GGVVVDPQSALGARHRRAVLAVAEHEQAGDAAAPLELPEVVLRAVPALEPGHRLVAVTRNAARAHRVADAAALADPRRALVDGDAIPVLGGVRAFLEHAHDLGLPFLAAVAEVGHHRAELAVGAGGRQLPLD